MVPPLSSAQTLTVSKIWVEAQEGKWTLVQQGVSKLSGHKLENLPWPLFPEEGKSLAKGGWEGFSTVQSIPFWDH
jgi:hypothetical protein